MAGPKELTPEELRRICDPERLHFATTADVEEPDGVLGQPRATASLEFGTAIDHDGYNLFLFGTEGTGRHILAREFLERQAANKPPAKDWCYVHNFEDARKPRALALDPGKGMQLRQDMEHLVEELEAALTAALESEEYQTQLQMLDDEFREAQSEGFEQAQKQAEERGFRLLQGPTGVMFVPIKDGKVLSPEELEKVPEEEKERLEKEVEFLQRELQMVLRQAPRWQREHRDKVRELDRQATKFAVGSLIEDIRNRCREDENIIEFLDAVELDVVEHARAYVQSVAGEPSNPLQAMLAQTSGDASLMHRYGVNVIVHNGDRPGAPVVREEHPTYSNLVGRTEHVSQFGALTTDFTLIRAGALQRANGGYLILDALEVLRQPYAWEGLKRALRSRCVTMESLGEALSLVNTVSLEPEPIPLSVKVVLIGEPTLYYMLSSRDPDFDDLFKVAVDFADRFPRSEESEQDYARLIARLIREEKLSDFDRTAVARVVEHAARLTSDSERLTLNLARLDDLLRESDHWARAAGSSLVTAEHVERAVDQQTFRSDRLREQLQDQVLRGTVQIASEGSEIGQVNGLSVLQLGGFAFGRPSRITARVRVGSGEVVDIEREVDLSGPIHSKGVLILSGFLGERYASENPYSLAASLVFEQSYGDIDGDSASVAELCALLSAIARVPIKQSLAVTGSMNQHGQVQAIGGANEKIEGFFDLCSARGLTGAQGVVIPASNVVHLMLRPDVVEAVRQGRFQVFAAEHVDQVIEALTGIAAGVADDNGDYPVESFNGKVQSRLKEFAHTREVFGKQHEESEES